MSTVRTRICSTRINNAAPGLHARDRRNLCRAVSDQKNLELVGEPTATLNGNDGGTTLTLVGGRVQLARLATSAPSSASSTPSQRGGARPLCTRSGRIPFRL